LVILRWVGGGTIGPLCRLAAVGRLAANGRFMPRGWVTWRTIDGIAFFAVPSNMSQDTGQLRLDFAGGAVGYRFRQGGARAHPLVKAAGFRKDRIPSVVDATAGLGRDAFLLASVGAGVVMLERSAEVHALLRDALARASAASPDLAGVVARMTLIHGDARDRLPKLRPDVVIIDPMHPPRQNSALVKQEMRLLSGIVGTDEDAHELMQVALASARERVVLKWPLRAAPLLKSPKPSHQFAGKTVRYEVFLTGTRTSET
jgi:16S rRNA (guanine1516-N2)-methyltransferase